jgi:hypothetical protein
MKVNATLYTLDLEQAVEGFRKVFLGGGSNIVLNTQEDYHTKKFEYHSLSFDLPHDSEALGWLDDNNSFLEDSNDLHRTSEVRLVTRVVF